MPIIYKDQRPDNKVHRANMGSIWGRQDPGGPRVGPMNFAIWGIIAPVAWDQFDRSAALSHCHEDPFYILIIPTTATLPLQRSV